MKILDDIRDLLSTRSSVQMVADDPHMAAEIMLLVRMMFADGMLDPEEMKLFKHMCRSLFEIPEEDVPGVIEYLRDTGYETTGEQAAALYRDMPDERRRALLGHLLAMARADERLHDNEADMISRCARAMGYTDAQVRAWL
ncbi:TerB family tellurite resistance protein [Rhizobiaceae bacterium]|nr:TerB family tellurite resistance protein [Rhizobiaceae bacterium]